MGEISDAFLTGIQELYYTMFTKQIYISFLNEDSINLNIFRENEDEFHAPIALTGKVGVTADSAEERKALEDVKFDFTFTIPTKEFRDKNIPHSPQDYATIKKAKIVYRNVTYDINYIMPLTNIEEVYLFYKFFCVEVSKESGEEY
jgi:hypothetical protein